MKQAKLKVFNTPLEIGFRALIILGKCEDKRLEVEQLMFLDYLSQNTNDHGGPSSLGAPIPNRGVQAFARKEVIQKGVTILLSKDLATIHIDKNGFSYSINQAGLKFLQLCNTPYFLQLTERVAWVVQHFDNMSSEDLRGYINKRVPNFGGEFI